MAQLKPFAPDVEVNGETVMSTVNSFPDFMKNVAMNILNQNGIINPEPGMWYSQQAWLNSFKEISDKFGSNTLFQIGKAIPANAKFPPEIDNIEKALGSIDIAYHMNHRNGDIGYYKLVSHNKNAKKLIMQCRNPYPCDFDRGIITAMARKFQNGVEVELDSGKPSRKDGADESWYVITY